MNPRQQVKCSCGLVFLDMDAWEYIKVARAYLNRGKGANIDWQDLMVNTNHILSKANEVVAEVKGFYDKFTCNAILHWCENPDHTIIVSVPLGNDGPLQEFDMTKDLKFALDVYGQEFLLAERRLMELAYDESSVI